MEHIFDGNLEIGAHVFLHKCNLLLSSLVECLCFDYSISFTIYVSFSVILSLFSHLLGASHSLPSPLQVRHQIAHEVSRPLVWSVSEVFAYLLKETLCRFILGVQWTTSNSGIWFILSVGF